MAATAQCNVAGQRRRTRRWRRRKEMAERGTRPSTSTAQTALRLKTASTRAVSTGRWCRRRHREVRPAQGLQQKRTAMGPQTTAREGLGRRRGTKNPGVRARRRSSQQRNGGEGSPERSRAPNAIGRRGGEGGGGTLTQQRVTTARSEGTGGPPNTAVQDPPARKGTGVRGGIPARARSTGARRRTDGDEPPPPNGRTHLT